jgi:hypothetical protein
MRRPKNQLLAIMKGAMDKAARARGVLMDRRMEAMITATTAATAVPITRSMMPHGPWTS